MSDTAPGYEEVTELVLRLASVVDAARRDPGHASRWRRRRDRAEMSVCLAEGVLDSVVRGRREGLLMESVARVCASWPAYEWRRPDVELVLADLHERLGVEIRFLSREDVARVVYGGVLTGIPEDLALVKHHGVNMKGAACAILVGRTFAGRPNQAHWPDWYANLDAERRNQLLRSGAARLPRPVTVWRGEHPAIDDAAFAEGARRAQPGDVLVRDRDALSASMDPAVAADNEFTFAPLLHAPREATTGWVLEITTTHAVFIGHNAQGLAHEQEVLVAAGCFVVTGVREALVDGRHGLKRIQVIACEPQDADAVEPPTPDAPPPRPLPTWARR